MITVIPKGQKQGIRGSDIIFLSYHEPHAEKNYSLLLSRFENAKHVHGIKGFINALRTAAETATSEYFYLVDADNVILDSFDFTYDPYLENRKSYIWKARNNVNGLEYGYGGVKMYHKEAILDVIDQLGKKENFDDVHYFHCIGDLPYTPDYKSMDEVASITIFDPTAFDAWRGAFRECCKLAGFADALQLTPSQIDNAKKRLDVWCNVGGATRYGAFVIDGARQGRAFGLENQYHQKKLLLINDFEWLKSCFERRKPTILLQTNTIP